MRSFGLQPARPGTCVATGPSGIPIVQPRDPDSEPRNPSMFRDTRMRPVAMAMTAIETFWTDWFHG